MAKENSQSTTISIAEIEALLLRVRDKNLSDADLLIIDKVITLFLKVSVKAQQKKTSITQLRTLLFGEPKNNKAAEKSDADSSDEQQKDSSNNQQTPSSTEPEPKPKKPGHGRNPASAYTGAKIVHCQDANLQAGLPCLDKMCKGHLNPFYRHEAPFIQLEGQPLIGAIRYDQELFRCSACTTLYTAGLPAEVLPLKYMPSADAAIAIAKYGSGLPFNRLSELQKKFGVPLPASVAWERCESLADTLLPIFFQMRSLAAQSIVLYYDDTRIKIINCPPWKDKKRKGIRTTGIVADLDDYKIALYLSGRLHAGDNVTKLLKNRPDELDPIIRMCDALKLNFASAEDAIIALCLAHGRRKFVDLKDLYEDECQPVIDVIAQIYANESRTKDLTPAERLHYHQLYSAPLMELLREWMLANIDQRKVEPNSSVGSAYNYLLSGWENFIQFLKVKRAPLDNNVAERSLKLVVLNRKNSYYFRTTMGALVSDVISSVIESCKINSIEPFSYLVSVIENERAVKEHPAAWLPWLYAKRVTKQVA